MPRGRTVGESRVSDPEVTDVPKPTNDTATRPTPGDGPPPPSLRVDGPPPPPAQVGGEGESRSTAAAWVATVGASLLLAAAGTFLAVSWDGLGLAVRVAVVASVTGAAILAGHRLRRVLPAVGAAVFHLGALLLPLDALGLAYQLNADQAVRWAAFGLTAALALPPLAVVGRSRVLGVLALAGIPITATAAGLAGLLPPAVVLAAVAVAALVVEVARRTPHSESDTPRRGSEDATDRPAVLRRAGRLVGPAAAAVAVVFPLGLGLVVRAVADGSVLGTAAAAWVPGSWVQPAVVGAVTVAVLVVLATRRREATLAGGAIAMAVAAVVGTLVPVGTPRAVLLLAPAVVWLLTELAALVGRKDRLWATPARLVARILEAFAVVAIVHDVSLLVGGLAEVGGSGAADAAIGARSIAFAGAWLVAAVRLVLTASETTTRFVWGGSVVVSETTTAPERGGHAVVLAGLAVVHVAAGSAALDAPVSVTGALLVGAALATVLVLLPSGSSPAAAVRTTTSRAVAPFVAIVLLASAASVLSDQVGVGALLVVLPGLVGAHSWVALQQGERPDVRDPAPVVASALLLTVPLLATVALLVEALDRAPAGVAALVAAVGLLGLAGAVERLEPAADSLRALAVAAGVLITIPAWSMATTSWDGDLGTLDWLVTLRVGPSGLVPAVLVGAWLTVVATRRRCTLTAALAVPVLLRALTAGLFTFGMAAATVGGVLLVLGLAAAGSALAGPRPYRAPAGTGAVLAGLLGWSLIGDAPLLRASVLVAAGLVIAVIGIARRRPGIAHLGGVVAVIGTWQVLSVIDVDALDLWLLPVAAHLTIAGAAAQRRGASSWIAFVAPLLLVAVPAVVERLAGGPGWHAVLGGGVGILAVVAGGARRLGGPLIVGTVVTVVVVLVESLAVVAAVPTWVWLAVGGVALLGAAALIERVGGSPVTAVRRAVDVVGERFD